MADRKAELEKKRQKLEELKKAREQKKKEAQDKETVIPAGDPHFKERRDVDELVSSLIGPTSSGGGGREEHTAVQTKPSTQPVVGVDTEQPRTRHAPRRLVVDQQLGVNIRPVLPELYTKCVQTDVSLLEQESVMTVTEESTSASQSDTPSESLIPPERLEGAGLTGARVEEEEVTEPATKELTSEECENMLSSNEFQQFLTRTSLVMERALTTQADILFDCNLDDWDPGQSHNKCLGAQVVKRNTFFNEKLCAGRIAMDTHWSPHNPELLVSSFAGEEQSGGQDGLALVWNVNFHKDTPDYTFQSQSPVVSTSFAKFHPSYIIGGTLSGQVMLWDMRSSKRIPVQRSPLSSQAHTYPVYCVGVVGTENAHNLITVSSDGRLCSWSLDMLSQPQESLELQSKQGRPIMVSSMSFLANEVNRFVVGGHESVAYQAVRHGSKPGVVSSFEGHGGPITSVCCHGSTSQQQDLSHLFLTASFDWTVKLWSTKHGPQSKLSHGPLCSFEIDCDYVYDVKWSPQQPAVFGCVNGSGDLQLWNINEDSEAAVVTENVGNSLNTLEFTPNGRMVALGDIKGHVHIYELGESLYTPSPDEASKLARTLRELQQDEQ